MMDHLQDFVETAQRVAKQMAGIERPKTWTGDDGRAVTGWAYESNTVVTEDIVPSTINGFWSHEGHENVQILATDGTLWHFQDRHERRSGCVDLRFLSVSREDPRWFVGNTGTPFSRAKNALERLPYR